MKTQPPSRSVGSLLYGCGLLLATVTHPLTVEKTMCAAATPEESFGTGRASLATNDLTTPSTCLTPAGRERMAMELAAIVSFGFGFGLLSALDEEDPEAMEARQAEIEAWTCAAVTPEETFSTARISLAANDLTTFSTCLTPAGRERMAMELVAIVSLGFGLAPLSALDEEDPEAMEVRLAEIEARSERFQAILTSYGLTDPASAEGREMGEEAFIASFEGVDPSSLIADLEALMASMSDQEERPPGSDLGDLTELEIAGDSATARAGDESIAFQRVGGLWYLEPPESPLWFLGE